MTKLRVYEYAKELNMSSKEIVSILKRLNVPVNNHMSVIDEEAKDKINQFFQDIKRKANADKMKKTTEIDKQPEVQDKADQRQEPQAETKNNNRNPRPEGANQQRDRGPRPEGGYQQRDRGPRPEGGYQQRDRGPRPEGGYQQRDRGPRPEGGYQQRDRGPRPEGANQQRDRGPRPEGGYQQRDRGPRPEGGYQQRDRGPRPEGGYQQRDRGPRPEGGYQQRDRGPRPEGGYQQRDRGPRPEGGYQQRDRGPRPEGGYQQRDRGPRPEGGYQKDRGPRDGGNQGNRGTDKRMNIPAPPAPAAEEQVVPRRRNQPKKPKEKAGFDENKKVKSKLKNVIPKVSDYDNDRGEVVSGKKRNKNKKNRDVEYGENKETPTKIAIAGTIAVGEFAKMIGKDPAEIIKKLFLLGIMATINQEIDMDTVTLIAGDYGIAVEEKIIINEDEFETIVEHDDPESLVERPPVVTIMGHVDHGKTTLLDSIRKTKVVATEAGGITQHIGAYQVEINNKRITFLDTPGHAAFTSMRARGAKVTDITILVVAADDGVMPQTIEAINHAKAAEVPIIVAVNKMDKPAANPDRVKQELSDRGLLPEEWGGDTIFVPVSALKNEGIDELLEMILLVAEVQEYKANPNKRARGTVIEAELDKGQGPVATVLVQSGTLHVGDPIVVGTAYGRIRYMVNDEGKRIKEAPPSTPVMIIGLNTVPEAGDQFMVFEDERKAKAIGERRAMMKRETEMKKVAVRLDDIFQQIKEGEIKDLNVIIKGDVQGSVEALRGSLEKINIEGVRVRIIHTGVGAITESDVTLAAASNAIIIGFNVRPDPNARATAEQEKVDIRLHRIIYNVIEEIESALKGMLDPEYQEKIIGQAEVRQTFKVSRVGTIAGCYVTDGKVTRDSEVRVIRDGVVIFEGKLDTLKRFKDDVKEVNQGYECGITIENFNDIKEGDVIEAFIMEVVAR